MTVRRLISCDIPGCDEQHLEIKAGDGWPSWGIFQGIKLNGVENPCLCPKHVSQFASLVDGIKK